MSDTDPTTAPPPIRLAPRAPARAFAAASSAPLAALTAAANAAAASNTAAVSSAGPAPLPPPTAALEMTVALAAVLALAIGGLYLLRRLGGLPARRERHLTLLDLLPLGTRERLVLVEADGRRLLLAACPGQVHLLCDLGVAPTAAPAPAPSPAATAPPVAGDAPTGRAVIPSDGPLPGHGP